MPIPFDLDTPEEQDRKMWERATPGSVVDPTYAKISRDAYARASRTPGYPGIVLDAVGYMAMLLSKGRDNDEAKRNFEASMSIRGKKAPPGLADKALETVQALHQKLGGGRTASQPEKKGSSREALIRQAAAMPKNSTERREILALLKEAADPLDVDQLPALQREVVELIGLPVLQVWEGLHGYIVEVRGDGNTGRLMKKDLQNIIHHRAFRWLAPNRAGFSVGM